MPFPFGLEEGCSARIEFQLNCTDISSSKLKLDVHHDVFHIDIDGGIMGINKLTSESDVVDNFDPLYQRFSSNFVMSESLHWAVANLSCHDAKKNVYICMS